MAVNGFTVVNPEDVGHFIVAISDKRRAERETDIDETPITYTVEYGCGHRFEKNGINEDVLGSSFRFENGVQFLPVECANCLDLQETDENPDDQLGSSFFDEFEDPEYLKWRDRVIELLGDDWEHAQRCMVGNVRIVLKSWHIHKFTAARVAGNLQGRVDRRRAKGDFDDE